MHCLSAIVGFVFTVNRGQEIIENKVSHVTAQALANCEICPEMDSGENATQRGFLFLSRIPRERALRSRHDLRRDNEVEAVPAEERNQNGRPAGANNGVRSGVGGVRSGVADLWKPVRVGGRIGIVVCCSGTYCGDWAPEVVSVFSIVESNHVIRERQIKQRK